MREGNFNNDLVIKGYSDFIRNYVRDWNFIVDISFKYGIKDYVGRKNLRNMKLWLERNGIELKGFVVMERNKNYNIHYHSIIKYECIGIEKNESEVSNMIFKYLKNYGSVMVRKYDLEKGDYSGYICKKLVENDWNFDLWENL